MGILGKIFLVLNVLVSAGVLYLGLQDWARRQEITAAAARQQLLLEGLQVDPDPAGEDEVVVELNMPGGENIRTLNHQFLAKHLEEAQGGQAYSTNQLMKSQIEEVKRVKDKIQAQLTAAQGDSDKMRILCGTFAKDEATKSYKFTTGLLANLAESYEERDAIRRLAQSANDPKTLDAAVKSAKEIFELRFKAVLEKPNQAIAAEESKKMQEEAEKVRAKADEAMKKWKSLADAEERLRSSGKKREDWDSDEEYLSARKLYEGVEGRNKGARVELEEAKQSFDRMLTTVERSACHDAADRRRRVAHLLMHVDPSPQWQKRVIYIVGLRTYRQVLADQVNRFQRMASATLQQIAYDQLRFTDDYETQRTIALSRSLNLDQLKVLSKQQEEQRQREWDAVMVRAKQLNERQNDLKALQAEVQKALDRQAALEKLVFSLERRVGETMDRNFEMNRVLGEAEEKVPAAGSGK